jgi:hypothetical protein
VQNVPPPQSWKHPPQVLERGRPPSQGLSLHAYDPGVHGPPPDEQKNRTTHSCPLGHVPQSEPLGPPLPLPDPELPELPFELLPELPLELPVELPLELPVELPLELLLVELPLELLLVELPLERRPLTNDV